MTDPWEIVGVNGERTRPPAIQLQDRIRELERLLADRDRQIVELRAAVAALMAPAPSELRATF